MKENWILNILGVIALLWVIWFSWLIIDAWRTDTLDQYEHTAPTAETWKGTSLWFFDHREAWLLACWDEKAMDSLEIREKCDKVKEEYPDYELIAWPVLYLRNFIEWLGIDLPKGWGSCK